MLFTNLKLAIFLFPDIIGSIKVFNLRIRKLYFNAANGIYSLFKSLKANFCIPIYFNIKILCQCLVKILQTAKLFLAGSINFHFLILTVYINERIAHDGCQFQCIMLHVQCTDHDDIIQSRRCTAVVSSIIIS